MITEVKNVARQGLTQQLRDLIQFARENPGMKVKLWVRETTVLTKPLQEAIVQDHLQLCFITLHTPGC